MSPLDRISLDPTVRFGKPCVRGTRITVGDILGYLAGGMSEGALLVDFPQLSHDDIRACLTYAAERERRTVGISAWTVRLLFDEQLSEALVQRVADEFPGALHVRVLGRGGALDLDVWEMAREHGCVLVTKDEDFHRLSLLRGAPPKVVWLRIGNCATEDISRLLSMHADDIRQFEVQASATVLELG
jgi:predicted nuclease of predicted toxin-antitoxin system/uncharacterized protein (DUF433 family)